MTLLLLQSLNVRKHIMSLVTLCLLLRREAFDLAAARRKKAEENRKQRVHTAFTTAHMLRDVLVLCA
jgi:hypothetical protein